MKLSLEFLGSGTSVGIPVIGCDCAVCTSSDPRNRRLRSSAVVRGYDDSGALQTTVLIDTAPDLREQALRTRLRHIDAVIITHHHADHVVGIDDLRRFNALKKSVLDCWAMPSTLATLRQSFGYVFVDDGKLRPGLPCLRARPITLGEPFQVGCLTFAPFEMDHHIIASLGLCITCRGSRALAYCLDVKTLPEPAFAALRGVDTLVLDMLREKQHPTHMNLTEALQAVSRIAPRRTFFGHMAHEVEHQTLEAALPPEIRLAYDGLVLEID